MAQTMGACRRTIDGHGKIVKVTPALRVYLLGAILCAALIICSGYFDQRGGRQFLVCLAAAGLAYLLAVREFFATPQFPRRVIVIGLALAAMWHGSFLRLPPGADDDIHRYVWDGRVQRLGYNPYIVVPNDPTASRLHTSETRTLNNPDLSSPYPAGAQLFFRLVTAVHESGLALKVAFVLCDLAIMFLYVPFLDHHRVHFGSLGTYVQSFRFNDPVFAILERVATPQVSAVLAVLIGFLTAVWMRKRSEKFSPDAFVWPMAASLLCAPVVYPWYLLWLLPFMRSISTLPLIVWTVSIIPIYYVWHLRAIGRDWVLPGWIMMLEYGFVAIVAAIVFFRRNTRLAEYNAPQTK